MGMVARQPLNPATRAENGDLSGAARKQRMNSSQSTSVVVVLFVLSAGGCPSVTPTDILAPDVDAIETVVATFFGESTEKPTLNYDAFLERMRSGDCPGLSARIGTCGRWLVIVEGNIDSYTAWYFDSNTKLLAAEYLYDPMSNIVGWTFGYADCDVGRLVQTELSVCGSFD